MTPQQISRVLIAGYINVTTLAGVVLFYIFYSSFTALRIPIALGVTAMVMGGALGLGLWLFVLSGSLFRQPLPSKWPYVGLVLAFVCNPVLMLVYESSEDAFYALVFASAALSLFCSVAIVVHELAVSRRHEELMLATAALSMASVMACIYASILGGTTPSTMLLVGSLVRLVATAVLFLGVMRFGLLRRDPRWWWALVSGLCCVTWVMGWLYQVPPGWGLLALLVEFFASYRVLTLNVTGRA